MALSEFITWTDANNNLLVLHGNENLHVLRDRKGLDDVKFDIIRETIPGRSGSKIRAVRVREREFTLKIYVIENTPAEYIVTRRILNRRFNPVDGPGILSWTSHDGTVRFMNAYYLGGLEGDDSKGNTNQDLFDIKFLAVDPFWYETEISQNFGLSEGSGEVFLSDPFFPLSITESTVFAAPIINNTGDFEAFPVIMITGPGDSIVVENSTTGKKIEFSNNGGLVLIAGQQIEIDTRPDAATVINTADQLNLFNYLSKDSEFFSLQPGNNTLTIQINGADVNTELIVNFNPTYTTK